nr:ATP-binding protein [Mammaliicoccus sp. Marseille-Q6498]
MKSFKKIIILNIVIALIVSLLLGILLNKTHTNKIDQRLDITKEIINLKIDSFISESNSLQESLTTILSNTHNEKFINKFLEDNHTRYKWIDHIYILDKNKNIVYDSLGKGHTNISDFNSYKYQFPFTLTASLSSKTKTLSQSKTMLLTNKIIVSDENYTAVIKINMEAFKNEIKLISNRYNIQVSGLDGTKIYQVGPEFKHSKSTRYQYRDLPISITISSQYDSLTRVIIPSIFNFLLVFSFLTIILLIYKSKSQRLEHEKLIEQANSEKLRLIGTLAANTAHEIKNPLTSINGFIELTRRKYDKDKVDTHFNIITEELDRINNIVTQFLYLGKPTNLEYTNVNISQTIKDIIQFSEYELEQNNIKISVILPNEPVFAYLSEDQLKQILINLLQNAKDALTETKNAHITIQLQKSNSKYATLEFKDNGVGMSKETQDKIFDPFFTTKESGSGLGLYLSKKLIEDWNGQITVFTNLEKGTTFLITLPIAKQKKGSETEI